MTFLHFIVCFREKGQRKFRVFRLFVLVFLFVCLFALFRRGGTGEAQRDLSASVVFSASFSLKYLEC